MKKIIIFGTSEFAEVAYFYLTHDSSHDVSAFCVNEEFLTKKELFGLPVVPFEKIESLYPCSEYSFFVAIGYSKVNKVRTKMYEKIKSMGYELISYINSKVTHWEKLDIGENCFILENVVIQPFVKIGNNVIIWSGSHIGHHTEISDHCFITSHVVISGNVKIGPYCFLGVNSTIRDGINIGSECVIGAGSVILKNTKDKEVYSINSTKLLPIKSDKLTSI